MHRQGGQLDSIYSVLYDASDASDVDTDPQCLSVTQGCNKPSFSRYKFLYLTFRFLSDTSVPLSFKNVSISLLSGHERWRVNCLLGFSSF